MKILRILIVKDRYR